MSVAWAPVQLRRMAECWDYLRIPLNAEERHQRPGPIPYWGANSIQGYVDEPLVSEEIVLIGEDGAPFFDRNRPVAFCVDEPIWPNNHIHVLKPNSKTDARWLAYVLNDVDYSLYIAGSTRDKLTQSALMRITVPTPPLDEQRAIADYLDRETARIDALIEEQGRLIELLRERRRAAIAAAFSRDSDARLRNVIEVAQTGPFGTQLSANEYFDDGIPVINPSHIKRGCIEPDPSVAVDHKKAAELARWQMRFGDIVLGRKGEVDKSALVGDGEVGYICGSDSMLLRPSPSTDCAYLWWFFQSPECHSQLEQWSVGSTVAGLNQTTISKIVLPLPHLDEQRRIVAYLDEQTAKIDTLIVETETFIELARERRAALITAAVTGQIDVRQVA